MLFKQSKFFRGKILSCISTNKGTKFFNLVLCHFRI
nr:MAG TPA: hypothetical protein [Caudoviricetes sp.]